MHASAQFVSVGGKPILFASSLVIGIGLNFFLPSCTTYLFLLVCYLGTIDLCSTAQRVPFGWYV